MAKAIFFVHITIIIFEVFTACVIRWVYVDYINLTFVRNIKHREGMIIVALYY